MGFPSDSSNFERISTKTLAILFGLAIAGGILLFQFIGGFPLKDLFQPPIKEVVQVKIKTGSVCVVEPSDQRPRQIQNCPYNVGDRLDITYRISSDKIDSYSLAKS